MAGKLHGRLYKAAYLERESSIGGNLVIKAGREEEKPVGELWSETKRTEDPTAGALASRFAVAPKVFLPTGNERLLSSRSQTKSHPAIEAHKRLRARLLSLSGNRSLSS